MGNSPPLSAADKTISMSNSPHPFSSILKGGRVNAASESPPVSLCLAPPCGLEWEHGIGIRTLILALVEGGMQLVQSLAEDGCRYLFAMLIEEEYLDVPLPQWETFDTRGLVAGTRVSMRI